MLVDTNFISSCATQYLTRSRRYRVEHSKIEFVSTRGYVISSIYLYSYLDGIRCSG